MCVRFMEFASNRLMSGRVLNLLQCIGQTLPNNQLFRPTCQRCKCWEALVWKLDEALLCAPACTPQAVSCLASPVGAGPALSPVSAPHAAPPTLPRASCPSLQKLPHKPLPSAWLFPGVLYSLWGLSWGWLLFGALCSGFCLLQVSEAQPPLLGPGNPRQEPGAIVGLTAVVFHCSGIIVW